MAGVLQYEYSHHFTSIGRWQSVRPVAFTLFTYFSANSLSVLPRNASDMFDKKKVRGPVREYCCSMFPLVCVVSNK